MSIFSDISQNILRRMGYTKNPNLFSVSGWPIIGSSNKSEEYIRHYTGWVYAMVKRRSEQMASVPIKLMRQAGNEMVEVLDHPSLELMDKANPVMTGRELRELTYMFLDLAGENFWVVDRGDSKTGEPKSIIPLIPHSVKVIPGGDKIIKEFTYTRINAEGVTEEKHYDPIEIVFSKEPNPTNFLRGLSVIQAAALTIDNDDAMEKWNFNVFKHGVSAKPIFSTDQFMDEDSLKRIYTKLDQNFSGLDNAGKPLVMHSGLKSAGNSAVFQKDLEFLEGQKWTRDKMMALIGVTKTILGITEDVNRANAEMNEFVFAKYMMVPRIQKFVESLNEFYLPMFKGTENLFFMIDEVVPPNAKEESEVFGKALAGGSWMTPNEVRQQKGLEPVQGGDKLYMPLGMAAIDAPKADVPIKFYNSRHKRVYRSQMRIKKVKDAAHAKVQAEFTNLAKKMLSSEYTKKTFRERASARGGFHDQIKQFGETFSMKMKKKMQSYFAEQEAFVKKQVQYKFNEKSVKSVSRFLFDKEQFKNVGMKLIIPLFKDILQERGNEALFFVGSNIGFRLDNPKAQKFIERNSANLIKDIDSTTKDELRTSLSEGVSKGEGIPDLQKRVEMVFSRAKDSRAEMIARTEVIKASNFASQEAWRQSGIVQGKEWLTAEDERVDDLCAAMDGEIVSLGSSFIGAGDTLEANGMSETFDKAVTVPPLHPNCRCTLIPVLESVKNVTRSTRDKEKLAELEKEVGEIKELV